MSLTALAGALAGLASGLFGGGGGQAFVPLMTKQATLPPRQIYPTCVALIFPVCIVSCLVYWYQGLLDFSMAIPYLAGGALGGFLGGRLYARVSMLWLRRGFAAFLLYGGVRFLWPQ